MMSALALCLWFVAAGTNDLLPSNSVQQQPYSNGLLGLGVGIELPMVGVLSGAGGKSKVGSGYLLGVALSTDVTPQLRARIYGRTGETIAGEAPISFRQGDARQRRRIPASWFNLEAGAGVAWNFLPWAKMWSPYLGWDVGLAFHGFSFRLEDDLAILEAPESANKHYASATGITTGLRAGLLFKMTEWLSTLTDLRVSYARLPSTPVTDTTEGPEVRSVADNIWTVEGTFSVRLGL